ncbi:MAG TPA: hypothetical protein VEU78_01370 [Steroidobacteraceae bacterium]|nr:hypothetical protein [Steroidobacteraceae bacterium]
MIVTGRFVFLHLHKSGGTFVNECLLRFVPDARQVGYHLPRSLVPAGSAALPVLGLVRNPWSYYLSWYAFQSQRRQPNVLFQLMSADRTLDFRGTVRNLIELGDNPALLDQLIAALPPAYVNRGINLPGFALEAIRGSGLGFYSYLYRYMYEGPGTPHIGCMERMRSELQSMFASVGQPVDSPMAAYIARAPAQNVSEHGHYRDYYDAALRRLVEQRDSALIERFGYRYGD